MYLCGGYVNRAGKGDQDLEDIRTARELCKRTTGSANETDHPTRLKYHTRNDLASGWTDDRLKLRDRLGCGITINQSV